jgi:hypothetical protein
MDPNAPPASNRHTWRAGQRVKRKDSDQLGTVIEVGSEIKVRWDNGQTSYFRHGQRANVELKPLES